jgi:hypothetical protein
MSLTRVEKILRRGAATREAVGRLQELLVEGLEHGFFDARIEIRTVRSQRRELIISAGKSFKFNIPPSELN